jgi:hypothetical protein
MSRIVRLLRRREASTANTTIMAGLAENAARLDIHAPLLWKISL